MKKIPVWKNVVLIVSGFVVVVVATFAWFYNGRSATGDNIGADVEEARFIQISGDGGNSWSDGLDVEFGSRKEFKEISGNGTEFFAPVYDTVENPDGGFSPAIVSFNKVNDGEYYYEQIINLRADSVQDVYLAPDSYVTAADADNGYIDGAVRVAFFELDADGNETLKCIWAPNSTVEYSAESNSFTREGSVEPYYYYQKTLNPVNTDALEESNPDVEKISTDGTDEHGCGYNQACNFMWSNGKRLPDNAPPILTAEAKGEDNNFYNKLKIKVWLEGHDRECVRLLSGQKFSIMLRFIAREVE